MQGSKLVFPVHIPGTLSADAVFHFKAPFNMSLEQVQAAASNASSATLKVGTTSDDDAYLTASDVGDSGAPAEYTRSHFVGGQYPAIPDGTVILVSVDHDGASGTAAQNLTVTMVFSEG